MQPMKKYSIGWKHHHNKYLQHLAREERREQALLILGVVVFLVLYAIAGTSDAYVLTH